MSPPSCPLGPPEIHRGNGSTNHQTPFTYTTYENLPEAKDLQTFISSLTSNPCLDFYFNATADRPDHGYPLFYYAEKAWKVDPLTTFKVMFSLRMEGKLSKDEFYKVMLWVYNKHPATLVLNVNYLGGFCWFTDLLGILYSVLQDLKKEQEKREKLKLHSMQIWGGIRPVKEKENKEDEDLSFTRARAAVDIYRDDGDYRLLHDRIADMFAQFLTSDLRFLESGDIDKISRAAQFCPSIDSNYDRATMLCENIARRVFPQNACEEYKDLEEAHYIYRVRDRLRKQVLVPLRRSLKSKQMEMTVKKKSLHNQKAPAALKLFRKISEAPEGSNKFDMCMKIADVFRINIFHWIKLPHRVIASSLMNNRGGGDNDKAAELLWQRLVQDFSNKGKLKNCVAVCDVPESARGTYKENVCIAMGLLISELSENPWKGMVFPFSDSPTFQKIQGASLRSKCEFMRQIKCADKLDFLQVYDRLLETASFENAKMPKRIFVFTYKDLGAASKNNFEDDYRTTSNNYKRKKGFTAMPQADTWMQYRKKTYDVPEIVFWNLNGAISKPAPMLENEKSNAGLIISGVSDNFLRMFLIGESDSRRSQDDYVPSVLKLLPKADDVLKYAVSSSELEDLHIFD